MKLGLVKAAVALVGLGGLLGNVNVALADPIGPDCGTCFGTIYTLTSDFVDVGSSSLTDTFDIVLKVDATGTTKTGLDAVAIKVAAQADWVSGALLLEPPGWIEVPGGLSAGGCNSTIDGFDCAKGPTQPVGAAGDVYIFEFQETVKAGTIFTGLGQASVKAQFEPNGLTSEHITLQQGCGLPQGCGGQKIPEPSPLALLGLLGIGLGFFRLRKLA
jgi:hypothetical protein